MTSAPALSDSFGRRIDYVRLSLTDRCDLRCRYCMGDDMRFLPRDEMLSDEEIVALAEAFVRRGVKRIRLTGGEPLVRRGAVALAARIGALPGLEELTLTTNGTRLAASAAGLYAAGIRRLNVSLDTLDRERFRSITRHGDLDQVLTGIAAATEHGLAVKINMVVLAGINDQDILPMLRWCGVHGVDLTLIETMPIGDIADRAEHFFPLTEARARIAKAYVLVSSTHRTGGPARYWQVPELGITLGLISPLTRNFCDSCNRIRVSAEGQLAMCLGHDDAVDLRACLRGGGKLDAAIDAALARKPRSHAFDLTQSATRRYMSATGG